MDAVRSTVSQELAPTGEQADSEVLVSIVKVHMISLLPWSELDKNGNSDCKAKGCLS